MSAAVTGRRVRQPRFGPSRDLTDDRLREKLLDLAKQYDQAAEAMERDEACERDHRGFQR
jgi:hypothetical protein